jgi:predicted DNA-binding protein YlxM (UPF0122 family)
MFRLLIAVVFISLVVLLIIIVAKIIKNTQKEDNPDLDVLLKDLENKVETHQQKVRDGVTSSESLLKHYEEELKKIKNLKQRLDS